MKIPKKYIPEYLNKKDKKKQRDNINNTRKLYKKGIYIKRPRLNSYKNKKSSHIDNAKTMYKVNVIKPNKTLSNKTKCSLKGLRQITKKGRGAFYSSGSRPMQTSQSWARARLASAITGGPASKYDLHILEKECDKDSTALKIAKNANNKN